MKFTLFVAVLASLFSVQAAPLAAPGSREIVARAPINERAALSGRDPIAALLKKDIKERAELIELGEDACVDA
ncbi:hypothetical protein HGRIS_003078 [Hohenbuehelia grisea]|uniref:Uncharacterized protein n=1 Tax=Hohenbuehelia grisea TaxID=104357 RepID=A0ABR3JMD8_9AGAR